MILDPRIDVKLADDVRTAEGCKLEAYLDSLGNWTIGVGHLLPKAAPGKSWAGFTVSQDVADRYFLGDLIEAWKYANKLPEWVKLDTECRRNALIEICFNMSSKWGLFVKARAAMEAQDWQGVHDELIKSLWASQVHSRADRIANYFLTGQYP